MVAFSNRPKCETKYLESDTIVIANSFLDSTTL